MSDARDIVDVPEPFLGALRLNDFNAIADLPASSAAERYARAIARANVGRENEARTDLEAAVGEFPEACQIELAFLLIRQRGDITQALGIAREIISKSPKDSPLLARACHIAGLAEAKLRRGSAAVDLLLRAARIYRKLTDPARRAQVYDTIGSVEAARGRLDFAIHFYSLSLVDKSLLNDQTGVAITMGNIGRVHLRLGRYDDALECFEHDLEMATRLNDRRGIARMQQDIGRTHLANGSLKEAEDWLGQCLKNAEENHFSDLAFFAHKDLGLLRIAQGQLDDAAKELAVAQSLAPVSAEPYLQQVLDAARGELALAKNDPAAVSLLESAVKAFAKADLPDLEIPARIQLARALLQQKLKQTAQDCLLKGMQRARRDGYSRYLPMLRQEMTRLNLSEGIIDEKSRAIAESTETKDDDDAYVIMQRLGGGAFGEVFRAYDPQRATDVALKRFHLAKLYDTRRRKAMIASARLELEAAARVRHPGVVRVMAVGFDPTGELYVVQDFVEGHSLRHLMARAEKSNPASIFRYLALIASALAALHEGQVIHRDLKPDNVIIKPPNLPVLVDFGIAHITRPGPGAADDAIAGTPTYMAPEQARGADIDGRADLYALGVIAYEWLAGVLPIHPKGKEMKQIALELASTEPDDLRTKRPELAREQTDLIMALLSKHPQDRPSPASGVAESFDRFAKTFDRSQSSKQNLPTQGDTPSARSTGGPPVSG